MSLLKPFQDWRARNPAKIAVAFGEKSWTYAEFDRLTDNVALNILAAGAEPGDRVALHLLNGPELAFANMGCLKAGCTVVPINTRLRGREIDYILRHSGSVFYMGQPDLYAGIIGSCPAVSELHARYLSDGPQGTGTRTFHDLLETPAHSSSLPEIPADHVAAILYTSGTTANPKGVVHDHETVLQTARMMRQMGLDEHQVVLVMSSMAHMIGFAMLFLSALLNGATTVITRPLECLSALSAYEDWNCTYTLALPVMFKLLLETQLRAKRNVTSGRFFFCGGDCVSPALQEAFHPSFAPVCEVYGATEIAPISWNRPADVRVGSIGKPGGGVTLRLVDSRGCDVASGRVGEVWLQGPHMMRGYWQDAEATAAAFHDGWFRTGDLGHRDEDGFYWFDGRKKEIIVHGGSNISPQEVEAVLYEHPAVAEVAVVGRPHPVWGEGVVAHVVLQAGQRVEASELIAFARSRLADYKVPDTVVFQAELPKSPTGKLQRRVLRDEHRANTTEDSAA